MAKLEMPQDSKTVAAIYAAYEKNQEKRFSRRLGASTIGKECPRAIWYAFRWSGDEDFDGRMLRLFETGHLAEQRFIDNLKAIGCEVCDRDESGQQFEFTEIGGHLVCKVDAMACGLPEAPKAWHVCEFKTHNDKSFKALKSKGLRTAKPEHFAQLVTGMKLSGVERGLYVAVNKDTDELYSERLRWEEVKEIAENLIKFGKSIVESSTAPPRVSDDPDKIPCKWCSFKSICHGSIPPEPAVPANVSCRSCCHATAATDGTLGYWHCDRHKKVLSEAEQVRACEDHLFIPDFVAFAEPVDGATGEAAFVEYASKADGTVWRNGKADGQFRSIELTQLPHPMIGEPLVKEAKAMGGTVVGEIR